MELEDVDLAAQLNGGESHSLTQKPGVETRLETLNLRGELGGEGNSKGEKTTLSSHDAIEYIKKNENYTRTKRVTATEPPE